MTNKVPRLQDVALPYELIAEVNLQNQRAFLPQLHHKNHGSTCLIIQSSLHWSLNLGEYLAKII